jgi:predicted nuclease with RNAse H fold
LREDERLLARAVCGIRWTPDEAALHTSTYYEWILCGLELYAQLARVGADWTVVECFPTASWTRWAGGRGARTRARWSQDALGALGLAGVPRRTSQDVRDAIAAAVTARLFDEGGCEAYGAIVVPRADSPS